MDAMTLNTSTFRWPTNEIDAERQAAAYLPVHGTRSDGLPSPWPTDKEFPKPGTVLRSLTQWFRQTGPQPLGDVPSLTNQWLTGIPASHHVMRNGLPWLHKHQVELWPAVAVTALLAKWDAVQHGQESPFAVPAVQDAVRLWTIDQDIRQHVHEAVQKVAQATHQVPVIDEHVIESLITTWRDVLDPKPANAVATLTE